MVSVDAPGVHGLEGGCDPVRDAYSGRLGEIFKGVGAFIHASYQAIPTNRQAEL